MVTRAKGMGHRHRGGPDPSCGIQRCLPGGDAHLSVFSCLLGKFSPQIPQMLLIEPTVRLLKQECSKSSSHFSPQPTAHTNTHKHTHTQTHRVTLFPYSFLSLSFPLFHQAIFTVWFLCHPTLNSDRRVLAGTKIQIKMHLSSRKARLPSSLLCEAYHSLATTSHASMVPTNPRPRASGTSPTGLLALLQTFVLHRLSLRTPLQMLLPSLSSLPHKILAIL